jgi:transposase-like protein
MPKTPRAAPVLDARVGPFIHSRVPAELVRLYSNRRQRLVGFVLCGVRPEHRDQPKIEELRQRHRRLSMTEVTELIKEYEQQATVKELAQLFGINRMTVTALLQRHGVELRKSGLALTDVPAAAGLYAQGWSLAKLGSKFDVDPSTVWRALRAAGVVLRSPTDRPTC